jgi:ElaB/YqjD/DUF883 family membrane-anchored ribosome-binding protein
MAEERNLGLADTGEITGATDKDATKAELQRRMEEARESISQTVAEIKDTVATQYQNVRETVNNALDWREQYRRRPIVFTVGAASLGFLVGYSIAGAFKGDEDNYVSRSFNEYDEAGAYEEDEYGAQAFRAHPIAAPAAAAGAATAYGRSEATPSSRPSYSSGYQTDEKAKPEEPEGPGLLERFKETRAYDRLQEEVSNIGNRVIDELSKTAQSVVIPLLLSKLKELIGVDASGQTSQSTQSTRHSSMQNQTQQHASGAGASSQTGSRQTGQTGQTGSTPGATATTQTPNANEPSGTSFTANANRATGSSS